MSELIIVILFGLIGLYWLAAMRCKEIAVIMAKRECKLRDVQLLDQTVHQAKLSLSRDAEMRWRVWREYRFEYSVDGLTRFKGRLTLLGQRPLRVDMETFNPLIH